MRRMAWVIGLAALPLAGCIQYDAENNAHSYAYLIDGPQQIDEARQRAAQECQRYERLPGLYNATQFQHLLVVFDCRPPGEVRFEVKPVMPAS